MPVLDAEDLSRDAYWSLLELATDGIWWWDVTTDEVRAKTSYVITNAEGFFGGVGAYKYPAAPIAAGPASPPASRMPSRPR